MNITKELFFLIYLNNPEESLKLSQILSALTYRPRVLVANNFDHFIDLINKHKIEFFCIDHKLSEVSAENIVERLRKSQKYHKSSVAFVSDGTENIRPEQFSTLNINFIINRNYQLVQFESQLQKSLEKSLSTVIPDYFRVLIVDDNQEILDIMEDYLKQLDHKHFKSCLNLEEAYKILNLEDFHLLIIDWNLPDGSCFDLINHIRKNVKSEITKNSLVIVETGRSDVDDIMTLLRFDVTNYLIKPFEFHEFEEKLTYAIDKHLKSSK